MPAPPSPQPIAAVEGPHTPWRAPRLALHVPLARRREEPA